MIEKKREGNNKIIKGLKDEVVKDRFYSDDGEKVYVAQEGQSRAALNSYHYYK